MAKLYLAFVDTPGIFAFFIRRFLKQEYIHVVLAMDENLEEAYSVGRRNPSVPLLAGMEREDKEKVYRAFPSAGYKICELECSCEQKVKIRERLRKDWSERFHFHYAVIGLPFLVANRPFYQKNHFTCSSYLAKVLEENGIRICEKHFSLVTPKDFYEYAADKRVIFEGGLAELVDAAYDNLWYGWESDHEFTARGDEKGRALRTGGVL